ncbi:MAG: (d)CMP kinase [Desulfobacteraceae bacterium]|nr:(d)CMP kinase [Desulfobacteraceae bacterium]
MLITIDGPAGAGKTTVSRMLAERLRFRYVDTGSLYRGIALAALEAGLQADDDDGLNSLLDHLQLDYRWEQSSGACLLVNGSDVRDRIRTPDVTMFASAASARPVVRRFLLDLQRRLGEDKCAVFEGRDMGTVVFPDADVKFFLDASLPERAKRRFLEMGGSGGQPLEEVESEMARRDANDSSRALAPLKPAPDAVLLDSTDMSAEAVVERMLSAIRSRLETVQ